MKCSEINLKGLSELNIEQILAEVEPGSGTYEEIKDAVDRGIITLLKDSDDNFIGIDYNSGKTGIEDTIEGMKFAKRFLGHDVLSYVCSALLGEKEPTVPTHDCCDEDDDCCDDSSEEVIVIIDVDSDLDGEVSEKRIAAYLRDTYNHYLSGKDKPQFTYEYDEDSNTVEVTNIRWGRKRYLN